MARSDRRPDDDQGAARLLERLLTDPGLRARFRSDPAAVARESQLDGLAGDFGEGSAMQTLEARESRSSLAGVMMAAALEGIAGVGLGHASAAHAQGLPPEVDRVLARHQAGAIAPASPAADPDDLGLDAPDDLPADTAGAQPAGWSPAGGGSDAGVYPVVQRHADAAVPGASDPLDGTDTDDDDAAESGVREDGGSGDTEAEADQESDGDEGDDGADEDDGDGEEDEGEVDEGEEDEDESGDVADSDDAADETTHDNDSDGDSGDGGDSGDSGDDDAGGSGSDPSRASDSGTIPDGSDPIDETPSGGASGGAGIDGIAAAPAGSASRPEVAAWMASEARKRGLPPELPVMASLVESGMRNLNYGDRDSVGFFQMRVDIWNRGEYAGYPEKPELQLKWFLDKALEVKGQRIARGQSVTDPHRYGDWIADIERPAEQYRGRYQLRLDEAREALAQGGSGEKPGHDGGDLVDAVETAGALHPGPQATAAIAEARKYLGTPYQWGGSSPRTGFDCSGLIQWAYAKAGIRIPRTTDTQFDAPNGVHVGRRDLIPGDAVYFRDPTGYVHHEGIYLGKDKFLHAPHTGDVVKVSDLDEPYYKQQFAGGRRFARGVHAAARAAASAAEPREPAVPSAAVRAAMAAVERDADEARRPGTLLFEAVRRQEAIKTRVERLTPLDPDAR